MTSHAAAAAALAIAAAILIAPTDVGAAEPRPSLPVPAAQTTPPPESQGPSPALVLPPAWSPSQAEPMPPAPAPLHDVEVPDAFVGCWVGTPGGFDRIFPVASRTGTPLAQPGEIVFCYRKHAIEVPRAEVYVPPAIRALDLAIHLGLGYSSYRAHGLKTDVYVVTPTAMRGRTVLEVENKFHLLYAIPIGDSSQPARVDWYARLIDRDTVRIDAYQVAWTQGRVEYGAIWHAFFKRTINPNGN
jgi:hypothetical protein